MTKYEIFKIKQMHELALFYLCVIIQLVEISNQVWNLERKEVNNERRNTPRL